MDLDSFKSDVSMLVIVALIIGAFVLAMDSFQDAVEDDNPCLENHTVWNASAGQCRNATDPSVQLGSTNYQYNITQEGLEGSANASSYLSTIGTLLGVAALIAIVVGAFMFVRK